MFCIQCSKLSFVHHGFRSQLFSLVVIHVYTGLCIFAQKSLVTVHNIVLVQIHPDIRDLMDTMNTLSSLPEDSEAKIKVNTW